MTSTTRKDDTPTRLLERGGRNDEPVRFDELGRDTQLLGLIRLVSRADPPIVVGVHGDWGDGKTSFMRVLQSLLGAETRKRYREIEEEADLQKPRLSERAEGVLAEPDSKVREKKDILTVWFNPWEHQFEDEPVLPLLDAIRHQHQSRWNNVKSTLKKVVEDPRFRIIGKASLGVAKMVGPGWFAELSKQIGDEARDVMDSFSQFRDEFEKCMDQLTREHGGRLVVFIDDLDRCEAEYVVKILEALKLHLLNRHCIFVLGCAEQRVQSCLLSQHLVADEDQAREYVEKIVQLPMHLPHVWDADFNSLLTQLGWERFTHEKNAQCFDLLRAFAGDNPRRLKRFLQWYDMERSMVGFVNDLSKQAGKFYQTEAVFLKIKLLQFAAPRRFVMPEDFAVDRAPSRVTDEE